MGKSTKYVARQPGSDGLVHYSDEEHGTWAMLYERQMRAIRGKACDEYFQGIISAKLRMRPVPGALASVLRERTDVAFSEAGTKKALEIARAAQLKDTTAAAMPEAADTTKKSGS